MSLGMCIPVICREELSCSFPISGGDTDSGVFPKQVGSGHKAMEVSDFHHNDAEEHVSDEPMQILGKSISA